MSSPSQAPAPQAYLLDIEGTTTPVTFVYNVLFPYARTHMRTFLQRDWKERAVRQDIESLRTEHSLDERQGAEPPSWKDQTPEAALESVVAYVRWLMDRDRKSTGLKSLQGKIWEAGYRCGELRGEIYPDVARAFSRWREQGREISIFSSGSVLAQKLLFAHTSTGDLTPCIRAYFDTTTGKKTDPESYRRIASELGLAPGAILFVSDSAPELEAASQVGMATRLCMRPKPDEPGCSDHVIVQSFDEL